MQGIFRIVAPLALLSCAVGALLLISGLAEKQTGHRLVAALVMITPLATMLTRRGRDWATGR